MEANEAHELQEHAEHGAHESTLRPVAFTMSVLAVLVAVTTVLGHRTHTEAVLNQNKATDQWNEYQAHKIRSNDTFLAADLLSVVTVAGQETPQRRSRRATPSTRPSGPIRRRMTWRKPRRLQAKVEQAEARADRFDLGEALLEIGLVITSVTLLTHRRIYWHFGMIFALGGILSAASVLLLK